MPVIPERTAYKHDVISAPSCIASSAVLYKWIEILRALPFWIHKNCFVSIAV